MIRRGPWTRETCSCSFFRKIVYKYPFLQRSIEKWKIEARLCVTLVDLLFYASFSPVCLCLATIGFHATSRFLSSHFLFFRICFFLLFFFIVWRWSWEWMKQWSSSFRRFFFLFCTNRKHWIFMPKFIDSFKWCFTDSVISTNKRRMDVWSWIFHRRKFFIKSYYLCVFEKKELKYILQNIFFNFFDRIDRILEYQFWKNQNSKITRMIETSSIDTVV